MHRVTWVVLDDHGDDAVAVGLPTPGRVVCADAGVTLALRLGLSIDDVVGDLDSVPPTDLARAEDLGARVDRHPVDKDATDLALALATAVDGSAPDGLVVVLGGAGGRLDHALANVHALADPAHAGVRVRGRLGPADVHVVRGTVLLDLPVGTTVTLLPSGGPATGVTTAGLRYPLADATLPAWSTRGVSNVVAGEQVEITVADGCVLAVVPHDRDGTTGAET